MQSSMFYGIYNDKEALLYWHCTCTRVIILASHTLVCNVHAYMYCATVQTNYTVLCHFKVMTLHNKVYYIIQYCRKNNYLFGEGVDT